MSEFLKVLKIIVLSNIIGFGAATIYVIYLG